MQQRRVGISGLKVSEVGLGTLAWGTDVREECAREQLQLFVSAGGTLVDTAAGYAGGQAEAMLGSLIGDVVARSEVVLVSKAGQARRNGRRAVDASRRAMLHSLDASLARFGTDYLDLWLAECWDPQVSLEETLSALQLAYESGRARYVGVSNYAGWQLALAAAGAGFPVVANEVEYSLLNRAAEGEVMPAAGEVGAGILAWAPLGRGVLTGKYRRGLPADSRGASDRWEPYVEPYLAGRPARTVEAVATAARGLDRELYEVALAWLLHNENVASAVVGARTPQQLKSLLAGNTEPLPAPIAEVLNEVSLPA
jgi:aryl-alcohol dehydrogenase-like predicted oxidoreductase